MTSCNLAPTFRWNLLLREDGSSGFLRNVGMEQTIRRHITEDHILTPTATVASNLASGTKPVYLVFLCILYDASSLTHSPPSLLQLKNSHNLSLI
jgi:thermostable 8-oxoguanine DNA glycosylase